MTTSKNIKKIGTGIKKSAGIGMHKCTKAVGPDYSQSIVLHVPHSARTIAQIQGIGMFMLALKMNKLELVGDETEEMDVEDFASRN